MPFFSFVSPMRVSIQTPAEACRYRVDRDRDVPERLWLTSPGMPWGYRPCPHEPTEGYHRVLLKDGTTFEQAMALASHVSDLVETADYIIEFHPGGGLDAMIEAWPPSPFPPDSIRGQLPRPYHCPCPAQSALGEYAANWIAWFSLPPEARDRPHFRRHMLAERRRLDAILWADRYQPYHTHKLAQRVRRMCFEQVQREQKEEAAGEP